MGISRKKKMKKVSSGICRECNRERNSIYHGFCKSCRLAWGKHQSRSRTQHPLPSMSVDGATNGTLVCWRGCGMEVSTVRNGLCSPCRHRKQEDLHSPTAYPAPPRQKRVVGVMPNLSGHVSALDAIPGSLTPDEKRELYGG
jgi:hypothetical protein